MAPARTTNPPCALAEARAYCRRLARTHYENFQVASCLLPRRLRQHFYNLYAYCRCADDLADESPDANATSVAELPAVRRLRWLDAWEEELDACFAGRASHPVFVALTETIREYQMPREPFADLLLAFRQDQHHRRYATFDDLLGYCRYSANPVGRLVLYLGRCHNSENAALSDSICTGLQLANCWQDVAQDYRRGRIYLPVEDCERFGYQETMLERHERNAPFCELLAFQVSRAEEYLAAGWPLVDRVPRILRLDVSLFIRGGCAILQAIRRANYDVWTRRPTLSRTQKTRLFLAACWSLAAPRGTYEDRLRPASVDALPRESP